MSIKLIILGLFIYIFYYCLIIWIVHIKYNVTSVKNIQSKYHYNFNYSDAISYIQIILQIKKKSGKENLLYRRESNSNFTNTFWMTYNKNQLSIWFFDKIYLNAKKNKECNIKTYQNV